MDRARRLVQLGGAVIVMAYSIVLFAGSVRDHERAIETARRETQVLADVLAQYTARGFEAVDRTLQAAAREYAVIAQKGIGAPGVDNPRAMLRELLDGNAALSNLAWFDATGDQVYNALLPLAAPVNIGDSPMYAALRNADIGLHVSPELLSPSLGKFEIPVARRINGEHGEFAGIISGLIDREYFTAAYRSVSRYQPLSVRLLLRDGAIVAQQPGSPATIDRSAERWLFSAGAAGSFVGVVDGMDQIVGFRAVPFQADLMLTVGVSRPVALETWWTNLKPDLAFYGAFLTLVAGAVWSFTLLMRAREQRQKAIETAKESTRRAQRLRALGTLAGAMAHEINNAITPILGFSDLLAASLPEGQPPRRYARTIVGEATRISDLIERVSVMSRREQAEIFPIDLAAEIEAALPALRSAAPANVTLEVSVDPACGAALAGEGHVAAILSCLVKNAVDALGSGPGKVTLTSAAGSPQGADAVEPKEHATITVTDDGAGMSEEVKGRLFEPFFTTKPVGSGVGLDLYGIQRILAAIGGHIEVDSALGKGTRCTVYLPRALAASGQAIAPAAAS